MKLNKRNLYLVNSIIVLILAFTMLFGQVEAKAVYENISNDSEWSVLKIVNKERLKAGKTPISMFKSIQDAASIRAKELIDRFDHTRPNDTSCFSALDEKKINYMSAGENIAAGQKNAKEVMNSWMNSEGHKANILNESFQHIGIGYVKGGNYKHNWVQMFIGGCEINSIKVNSNSTIKKYKKNTKIDDMNRYLIIKCSQHGTSYTPIVEEMCKGYKKTKTGKQTITVNFQGKQVKFTINITK